MAPIYANFPLIRPPFLWLIYKSLVSCLFMPRRRCHQLYEIAKLSHHRGRSWWRAIVLQLLRASKKLRLKTIDLTSYFATLCDSLNRDFHSNSTVALPWRLVLHSRPFLRVACRVYFSWHNNYSSDVVVVSANHGEVHSSFRIFRSPYSF